MKMVMVVYRHSLDQDIRRVLKGLDVVNFADAPKVFGIGDAGHAFGSITWPGHHAIILSAMEELQADRSTERISGPHGPNARGDQDSDESVCSSVRTNDLARCAPHYSSFQPRRKENSK